MSCNFYMYIVDLDYYPGLYFLCDNHIYYKAFITAPPVNIIISGFHTHAYCWIEQSRWKSYFFNTRVRMNMKLHS